MMEYKVFMVGDAMLQDTLNEHAEDGWVLNSILHKRNEMRLTVVMEREKSILDPWLSQG